MKSQLLILLVFLGISSCSKTESTKLSYPKTELLNTTWKRFSFKGTVSNKDVYEFLHFKSSSNLEIYSADSDGSNVIGEKDVYSYKLKISDKNMDSFEVIYPNGKSGMGFTTDNPNRIVYNDLEYFHDSEK